MKTNLIDDFTEQAGITLDQKDSSYYWVESKEDLYKFAKYIIKECILCCDRVISDPVPEGEDNWLNCGLQCIKEIENNFDELLNEPD